MLAAIGERVGLGALRRRLREAATGTVLEVGAGVGTGIGHYPPGMTEVVLTEPHVGRFARSVKALGRAPMPARAVRARAESLPFPDASFDTVICELVLCSVDDPPLALAEIRRVLTPGGRLLLFEHVRSHRPRAARWQDRLNPAWRKVAGGCNCNRDTLQAVRDAGFAVDDLSRRTPWWMPPFLRPTMMARARR